ncbi:hypothetical protein DPM19_13305 [Actinomadura craniellae]|uniref:Uncharacterized protein n=1 Tax=Actinomadura craniellae TaxID=2231787 RepID=A0A365H6H7_9ACTN|nr:hypothetical protein DPM19_13305 [Actinomadura craniellae]
MLFCLPVGPALAAAPKAAEVAKPRAHAARAQIQLTLNKISPLTRPTGGRSRVELSGSVANLTGQNIAGLSVRLRYRAQPLNSRYELVQHNQGSGLPLPRVTALQPVASVFALNSEYPWKIATSARALGMAQFGVYPVAVDVLNGSQQVIASQTTFLNFVPAQKTFQPTKIAWVWPLIDRQHRSHDSVFFDDRLERDLRLTGRLGGLVDAAKTTDTPITWAIDPALLDDVRAMTDGYSLRKSATADPARRPASDTAKHWLNELRTASATDPYFTLPYADPDAVALARNGLGGHLGVGYRHSGVAADKDLMNRQPAMSVAWPPQGAADQRTLDLMARYGRQTFLMTSDVLIPPSRIFTPSATTALHADDKNRTTIAYDSTLSKIVSADSRSPGAATLTAQRFLAETAMITAEVPTARTLVVVPNRGWNPDPAFARQLLEYTAQADWLTEVPLDQIVRAKQQPRTFIGYHPVYENYELGATYLREVRALASRARLFSTALQPPVNSHEQAMLRIESAAWRGRPGSARTARQQLATELDDEIENIRLVTTTRYTVAGKSGHLLITVANDLIDQTAKVRLRVTSRNPGLKIGDYQTIRTLRPGEKDTVRIVVQASGNVNAPVDLELLTPQGRKLGTPASITVRTTGYGRDALLITGGALAVLFVGVGTRAVRARRRVAAQSAGPEAGAED